MSEYETVYSRLRHDLASAYWQVEDARVVMLDVRIDPINIHWAEKPIVYWNDILIRAINENKIRDLLERACSGKLDMEVLKDRFLALYAGPDPAFTQEEDERLPFPLRRSYSDIVKDMRNGTVVPVLGPSVNPRTYIDLAALHVRLLVQEDFPNDPQVADEKEKKYVRAYYGSPCTICHFLPALVPPGCPLLAGVPKDVDSSVYDEQVLSVAKTNCRNLSQLYETRTNASNPLLQRSQIASSNRQKTITRSILFSRACSRIGRRFARGAESPISPFQSSSPPTSMPAWRESSTEKESLMTSCGLSRQSEESNRGKWLHLGYRDERTGDPREAWNRGEQKGFGLPLRQGGRV